MAVNNNIKQAVEKVAHTMADKVGVGVPPFHDRLNIEPVILADGDESPFGDEDRHLAGDDRTGHRIQPRTIGAHKQMIRIPVEFRPLMHVHGILDRQRV